MAKHANKPGRSSRQSQRASKNAKPLHSTREAAIPHDGMELDLQLLNCAGIDDHLATNLTAAITVDNVRSLMMCAELLSHEGASLFAMRWICTVFKPTLPPSVEVVDACKLAQICGSKSVLGWLIALGLKGKADEAFNALKDLSKFFGDGYGAHPEVNFAREVLETLFEPRSAGQARAQLNGVQALSVLSPHVGRFVQEASLRFLAREEGALLLKEIDRSQAPTSDGAKRPWL